MVQNKAKCPQMLTIHDIKRVKRWEGSQGLGGREGKYWEGGRCGEGQH